MEWWTSISAQVECACIDVFFPLRTSVGNDKKIIGKKENPEYNKKMLNAREKGSLGDGMEFVLKRGMLGSRWFYRDEIVELDFEKIVGSSFHSNKL